MNFSQYPQKGWTQRLVDWIFGAPTEHQRAEADSGQSVLPNTQMPPESTFAEPETLPVWVDQSARSPLEAFKDAITDATRLFCEQYVYPLYGLDQRTKYRITGIQMYVPLNKSSFLQVLEKLPIDVRNRMTRILVMAAPGAQDQLVIDDGFFGLSLDVEPVVVDGNTIRLIAAWSRDSAEVKFVFSGNYTSVDPKPLKSEAVPDRVAAPVPAAASDARAVDNEPEVISAVLVRQPEAEPTAITQVPPVVPAFPARQSIETPLGPPRVKPASGKDTPLTKPSSRQIAQLRIQYSGQDQETTVAITADMLPFVIGREHTSTGRFRHGISLADPTDDNKALLVSREHLELNQFHAETSNFYFINHGFARNGSYHQGIALPERFMLKAMAPGDIILLGGSSGVGTVRITIKAV
ncbi:hypothetical protein [Rhodoferax sp.]|uniref:hypothetical protein n=1 Tax=Rhodoferax sp. TaxID=50421 RepID=UPI00378419C3